MKYLVDFHHGTTEADIAQYMSDNGCTVIKEWNNYDKVFLVETSAEPPKTSIVEFVTNDELLAIQPVDMIDFNPYYQRPNPTTENVVFSTTEDKDWWKNYSLSSPIFDQPTGNITRKGERISVYVVDSGIEASHPEFANVSITNLYTVTPDDFSDTRGHGTAMASIISGATCGITNAHIKVVKIFDNNHTTLQSELLDAFDAIISDMPNGGFAVVNCSWTIPRNEWVEHKLKTLISEGAWVLAAAGNNGTTIEDVTPAAMPEAFTIGSYNKDLVPSDFSNFTSESHISLTTNSVNGGELDGWAPGENIYAAKLASIGGGCGFISGTSAACAVAAAVLVHNFADDVDNNGLRLWGLEGLSVIAGKTFICSRKDILDLSDPKYASSVNNIATLLDFSNYNVKLPPDEIIATIRVGEDKPLGTIFLAHNTKSAELLSPLPNNFKIMQNGVLHGKPTAAEGPQNGDTFVQYTVQVRRTNIDDTVEDVTVDIYVLGENADPGTLPADHPINITLAAGNCADAGTIYSSCFLYSNPPCNNNCPNSVCCDPGNKIGTCVCITSDRRLKSNIVRIGTHSLGIGLYEYDIAGQRTKGVMADEVLEVMPAAVCTGADGYYRVNYSMIGFE
jgi:hypothetical protein